MILSLYWKIRVNENPYCNIFYAPEERESFFSQYIPEYGLNTQAEEKTFIAVIFRTPCLQNTSG